MTSLTIVRRIRARPSIVYAALVDPGAIAQWWGPPDTDRVVSAESDGRVGGRFRVRFRKADGTEHESAGEFLELIDGKRVVMSWEWAVGGDPDERGQVSRVIIDLRPIDVGTELTFTHARLKTPMSRDSHGWGWGGALDRLERHLSGEAVSARAG
jgi:uncharacterized protein YndB with AHSA1/START domain